MGKDTVTDEYRFNMGFVGEFGAKHANLSVADADLLIVLGSRLDHFQTGKKVEEFAKNAKIIRVDIDPNELVLRIDSHIPVLQNLKNFLKELNGVNLRLNIHDWHNRLISYKLKYPTGYNLNLTQKAGNGIIAKISKYLRDDDIICVDVGEHQMLVAQSLKVKGTSE